MNSESISFDDNSSAVFSNNIADSGGAIMTAENITFKENSKSIFSNNTASYGGSVYTIYGHLHFKGTSITVFSHNNAADGGAIILYFQAYISFDGNSYTLFNNNIADNNGEAIYYHYGWIDRAIYFKGNSSTVFSNNIADNGGGAIFSAEYGALSFNGYSTTVFRNNIADYGGAIMTRLESTVTFSNDSTIKFIHNRASFGATAYLTSKSNITAKQNPTVMFDNILAKWCNNSCLHYTGQRDAVVIDGNGIVWCSNQNNYNCLTETCSCNKLEDALNTNITNIVNITDKVMTLSSAIKVNYYQQNISIIGHHNLTVICVNGGRLELHHHYYLIIEGINWIGCGGYSENLTPVILISSHDINYRDYTITIQNCSFQHSITPEISYFERNDLNISFSHCNFINSNSHRGQGAAIYFSSHKGKVTVNNSNFSFNGVAKSIIYINSSAKAYINNSNFYNNQGVSVYLSEYSTLHIYGKVLFENNVAENGAGIYISDHSTIVFDTNSSTKFSYNNATNGTIHSVASSNVTFKGSCEVIFDHNSATQYGAAIYSFNNSHITFTGKSKVKFINNFIPLSGIKQQLGGIIFSDTYSYLSFEDNSITVFSNNIADFGAAIYSLYNSNVIFKHNSSVKFNDNSPRSCGTLTSSLFSTITFNDNTNVTFSVNAVLCTSNPYDESLASAICSFKNADIIFSGHSVITFFNNKADRGGAVAIFESNVYIEEYSIINFNSNIALYSSGGAFECSNNSNVTIKDNSNVTFNNNKASQNGGAIYSYDMCQIIFKGNSTSTFANNNARYNGGVTLGIQISTMIFEGNSVVTFDSNTADNGGVFYLNNSIRKNQMYHFVIIMLYKVVELDILVYRLM